jgi:hypothetical protein
LSATHVLRANTKSGSEGAGEHHIEKDCDVPLSTRNKEWTMNKQRQIQLTAEEQAAFLQEGHKAGLCRNL